MTGENESPTEIHKSITIERVDLKTTHGEGNNNLVHQMVAAAQEYQKGVSVVSDDTNVFLSFDLSLSSPKPFFTRIS